MGMENRQKCLMEPVLSIEHEGIFFDLKKRSFA